MNLVKSRNNSCTKNKSEINDRIEIKSENKQFRTKRQINEKNSIPSAINKTSKNELEKLNAKIQEMEKLISSQHQEINRLQKDLNSEKSRNINLSQELEKFKNLNQLSQNFICQCKINQELQSKIIADSYTHVLDTDSENTIQNINTNMHSKSNVSIKKISERTKSPFDSMDVLKLDETHGNINDITSPTDKNQNKSKLVRSSSLAINLIPKEEELIIKKNKKRMNFSQDIIVNDYKRRKNEIDELFDDEMEKLIKRLQWSRTNLEENHFSTNKKKFHTLNKLTSFENFMTKEEKRKKLIEEFRTHCRENKQMLKTIAKNTESKLKTYLQTNTHTNMKIVTNRHNNKTENKSVEKGNRLHSVHFKKERLETESFTMQTCESLVLGQSTSRSNFKCVFRYNSKDKIFNSPRKDFNKNKLNLENKTLPDIPVISKTKLQKIKIKKNFEA